MLDAVKGMFKTLFNKESGRAEMVRFNKDKKFHQRKDTLYTKRYDNKIFYGIARLKKKSDKFYRETGVMLAKERAEDALIVYKNYKDLHNYCMTNCGLSSSYTKNPVFEGSDYGWVTFEHVKSLLEYFRNLGLR